MLNNVNYTVKFLLSDLYLQKQSQNIGLFKQGVPSNRCQQEKQTPVPRSIQSPQVCEW